MKEFDLKVRCRAMGMISRDETEAHRNHWGRRLVIRQLNIALSEAIDHVMGSIEEGAKKTYLETMMEALDIVLNLEPAGETHAEVKQRLGRFADLCMEVYDYLSGLEKIKPTLEQPKQHEDIPI